MKENIVTGLLAAVLAAGAAYLRQLLAPLIVLGVIMVIDYVTGMTRAWITKQMSSRIGIVGIVKKICYLAAVAVAIVVDFVIQYAAERAGVDLGGVYFFGLVVVIWMILNECISILENLSDIGVPLPGFLMAAIKRLKKTAESKGEDAVTVLAEDPVSAEAKEKASEPAEISHEDKPPDPEPGQTIPGEGEL